MRDEKNTVEITLTTPALLFPATSLLLLAYTNRFLALASLIRGLHSQYEKAPSRLVKEQIDNLRHRVVLIKQMQFTGILSLLLCVACMFLLYAHYITAGKVVFAGSLLIMMWSLALTLREIHISVIALNLQLCDIEENSDCPPADNSKEN